MPEPTSTAGVLDQESGEEDIQPGLHFRSLGAVTLCSFLQMVLQFLLLVWLAKQFGTSRLMDAFNAAFAVPMALTGVLVSPVPLVLVPELVRLRGVASGVSAWRLGGSVLLIVLSGSTVLAGAISIYSEAISGTIFSGLETFRLQATASSLRWLIWLLPLNAGIALLQAVHHSRQRYGLAAVSNVAGVAVSLGLIVLIPSLDLVAVSAALLAGSGFAVAVLLLPILKPLLCHFQFRWRGIGLRRFAWLAMPLFFSAAYAKLDPLVDRSIASFLGPGAISELGYAQRLITALTTLAASGLSVVIFPQFARFASNARDPRFARLLASAWRFLIILLTPCVAAIVFYAEPIVADLFQRDAFDAEATDAVARLLVILLGVLVAGSVGEIAAKSLYAMSETRIAALISVGVFTLGIVLKWFLSKRMGIEGVALGTSLYYCCGAAALLIALAAQRGKSIFSGTGSSFLQAVVGSTVAVAAGAVPVVLLARGGAFWGSGIGLLSYVAVLWVLRNEFVRPRRPHVQD